jgi:hypothetical protein
MAKKHAQGGRSAKSRNAPRSRNGNVPQDHSPAASRRSTWLIGVGLVVVVGLVAAGSLARQGSDSRRGDEAEATTPATTAQFVAQRQAAPRNSDPIPQRNPLNAERAYGYLKDICAIGRRVSGSDGMQQQQELLKRHFEAAGGKVTMQEFQATDPLSREKVPMANMIVTWHADRKERLILCAHYDTRPYPDRDPDRSKRKGLFIGANDGGSGVAVMMELAHLMPKLESRYGVDFVFFDGEELIYRRDDNAEDGDIGKYFLGSEHFAREYIRQPPEHRYRWGVLLDMVGDADLQIYQEQNSLSWRETRPLVAQIWGLAQRMNMPEFVAQAGYEISDDHLALRNIAKIPTCDVIDFDYPGKWHTQADVLENCSGESLAKVGWVMFEWFKRAQ